MSTTTFHARSMLHPSGEGLQSDMGVVVDDGVIVEVGPWTSTQPRGAVVSVDGILLPGFVDAHSHLRGVPLSAHGIPARSFESWICSLAAATPLDAGDEALVAGAELLETGVTAVQGFVDCGADDAPLAAARSAAQGIAATGIRALVMLSIADRAFRRPEPPDGDWAQVDDDAVPLSRDGFEQAVREWLNTESAPYVSLGVGPTGAHWATEGLLEIVAATDCRHHTHLHESSLHRSWLSTEASPFDRLDAHGLLTARMSAAHAVHLSDAELDRLAGTGVELVHCPQSNEALRVGTARVQAWRERGIPAALGVDSQNETNPDYFELMRAAIRVSRTQGSPLTAQDVLEMATVGGAAALGIEGGGRIAVGAPADLIELTLPATDPVDVVEGGSADAVRHVWVAGSLVVDEGASLVDPAPARERLHAALRQDAAERQIRLEQQASTLELVDRLVGASR